jgi:hypothetical protein
MSAPLWVTELTAAFWDAAGGPEPFPRTLAGPIARAPFDLAVKDLPGLTVRRADGYLASLEVDWGCRVSDRPLRACLAATGGAGFVLLDAGDDPRERVFSRAHELAHFLRHDRQPRRLAVRRLGEPIAAVLDGERPTTPAERFRALLANVPVGCHTHLMERGPRREILTGEVARAEDEADRLAFELLAPAGAVRSRVGPGAGRATVVRTLRKVFGLPREPAVVYARLLLPQQVEEPLLRRLRAETQARRASEG